MPCARVPVPTGSGLSEFDSRGRVGLRYEPRHLLALPGRKAWSANAVPVEGLTSDRVQPILGKIHVSGQAATNLPGQGFPECPVGCLWRSFQRVEIHMDDSEAFIVTEGPLEIVQE